MNLRSLKDEAYRLLAARKFKKAADAFRRLMIHDPKEPSFCLKYGEACRRLGDAASAVQGFRMAAELLADSGLHARASATLRLALQLRPSDMELRRQYRKLEQLKLSAGGPTPTVPRLDPDRTGDVERIEEVDDADVLGPIEPWPAQERDLSPFDFSVQLVRSASHRIPLGVMTALPIVRGVPYDPDDEVATDPFIALE